MRAILLVWLRYAMLGGAKVLGWVRRVLYGGWRRPLVWLTIVAAAMWLLVKRGPVSPEWWSIMRVVGVFALLALACWIWKARTRLVIGNFVDYTHDVPAPLPGLSALLQVELSRLYDLVNLIDQNRAVPDILKGPQSVSFDEQRTLGEAEADPNLIVDQPLDVPAPMMVEDLTDVLNAALSVEATMSVGPVKIPVGALAGLVGRLAQGPRLNGSLHRTEQGLVLTARTVGARHANTWRVDSPAATGGEDEDPEERPEDLLDELAVRIFTDLALEGSVKWQATWAYVNGLRAYRASLRTKKDRRLSLELAKGHFIETIAEDERFDLAHYNLGVVATELSQKEAAESAFLAAIRLNNQRWAPYYGLAQLYFANGRHSEVLPLCGRILSLRQHRAEAYHLRALSNRRIGDVTAAMKDRKAAVRWSWLRLCGAVVRGGEGDSERLAATSLRNLGCLRAYEAKEPRERHEVKVNEDQEARPLRRRLGYLAAAQELRQGRFVNPSDGELHFELGKIYAARRQWERAARQLEKAVEIDPDRPRFLIQLARAYAGVCDRRALFASERARAQPSLIVDDGFERLKEIYTRLSQGDDLNRVCVLQPFEQKRRTWVKQPPSCAELETLLSGLTCGPMWELTQVCVQLAERYVDENNKESAGRVADLLAANLDRLSHDHPREVKEQHVHALVAEALHAAGRDTEALRHAEAAVHYDPLSARARKALAVPYASLGHFEQATAAWRAALVCDPDGPDTNLALGEILVRRALDSREADARRAMFTEAITYLCSALKLAALSGMKGEDRKSVSTMTDVEGEARFWLGRAYYELDVYEQAVTHLQLCVTLNYQPELSRLRLGVAYLRMGHVSDGERVLKEIRDIARAAASSPDNGSTIVGPAGDPLAVRDVLAWSRVHLAGSHIERDVDLKEAIDDICEVAEEARNHPDRDTRLGLLAACADREGWANFLLAEHTCAIERLQESIRLEPTAEAYLHLAQVYANRALDCTAPAERLRDETRARHYYDFALGLGLGAQQAGPLEYLLRRLDVERDRPTVPGTPTADKGGSTLGAVPTAA